MHSDPMASITHHQLRVFVAVAGEGSFAGAAKRLFMSEPTVSSHIRTLERVIGTTLIDRSRGRRQVDLTPAGRVLLRTSQSVFQTLDQGLETIRSISASARRTISVGAGPHFGGFILPQLIEAFHVDHPRVTVRVEVGRNESLLSEMKRGRLDLAVLYGPIDDPEVHCEPYAEAHIGIIAPANHRLREKSAIPLEHLLDEPFILAEASSPPRRALEDLAIDRGLNLRIVMEAQDIYARILAVVNGLGIAPMYLDAAADALAANRITMLDVVGFPRHLERVIVTPRAGISADATGFLAHLVRTSGQQIQTG
jgi:molybdate transport repressor ModE-like protein